MSGSTELGYEIHLATPDETVLCVDARGVVRGMYLAAARQYLSPYECWCDEKGVGRVDTSGSESITAHDLEGRVLRTLDDVPIWNLGVTAVRFTDVRAALEKRIVVGIDEPARRPGLGQANEN